MPFGFSVNYQYRAFSHAVGSCTEGVKLTKPDLSSQNPRSKLLATFLGLRDPFSTLQSSLRIISYCLKFSGNMTLSHHALKFPLNCVDVHVSVMLKSVQRVKCHCHAQLSISHSG
ncbi:hypothetical protein MPTK1_4g16620 [Marchantia polymorpha subsp. ruderalis]|uniref:Uncharacterized protein n=2 Tax=Marchantia polymorpha TaxID=3197 RepID=A0AAF6BAK3_MARPO|nr:hypothetical protein MARPO_0054s0129 [Marchantia polymorpha]BBN09037.1 hypothetical protein Mp_4g16620 [Marchantia polymorpha subsp. ruderalis]|eukprot:PTQ38028.1 hypothetical protein MARPO_0054s0129 [Marchantia polymorpha]